MKTDCEILRCSIQLTGCKTIYLGAYHRLHEDDEQSLLELERSLSLIKDHHHVLLGGDFQPPRVSLNFIRLRRVIFTPSVTFESTSH